MKKKLQFVTLFLMFFFMLGNFAMAQELQLTKPANNGQAAPESGLKEDGGEWIKYYEEINDNALGLGGDVQVQWNAAIRWMPVDLTAFAGYSVTRIRIYMNDEPGDATAKIWQGTMEAPVEMVSQSMATAEEDWVEVELFDPYLIDITQELWIGWEIGDLGAGNFAAAFDDTDAHAPKSDLLQFGDNPWQNASEYNFDVAWNIEAYVVLGEPDPDPDDFMVTFRVNMAPAVADGFDPAVHNVFVTGDFAGWAEPGTEGSVELTLEAPAKDAHTFYEDFSDFDDFTTDLSPWINIDTHGNPTWGSSDFDFEGEGTGFGWRVMNPATTEPAITGTHPAFDGGKYLFSVASNPVPDTDEENKWLISPAMEVTADSELSFAAKSITAQYGLERMKVYVSTTGTDPEDFVLVSAGAYLEVPIDWTVFYFDLAAFDGETIHFAVENVSNDAFMLFLDAFTVTNLAGGDPDPDPDPDDIFFTATVEIPAGDIQYKYFSDAIGAGWAGGEWEGGDDRMATISADVTLDDLWADDGSFVDNVLAESGLNLFPNPVRNTLYVENASQINEVRIFDLTGRLVMSQVVNNNTASVNVSEFNRGVYIMQVISVNGVASQKFNVIK